MPLGHVTHSPDVSLKTTPGKIRYLRLNYLLVSGGTAILRKLLQNLIFPEELSEVLNKPRVLARLHHLRDRRKIFDEEWQLLYPPSGSCQPKSFDITLLTKILKQNVICSLSPPRTGWNNLPNQADLSLEADIVRIHQYRNLTCHINEKMEIRTPEFLDYWKQIKDALLRIVRYYSPSGSPSVEEWEKKIDDLLSSPLVADEDQEDLQQLPTQVFSLRCMIKLASVGAWLGGTIYVLNRLKNNPDVLANLVESTLPGGISVIRVEFGSIKLHLLARDLRAMEELRKRYQSGQLTKDLQKSIITEDLKDLANGEPVEFTVEMDEDEYLLARQYLCDNQETNDDTLCTTAKTVRKEEEDNLNEESTGKTVSLEKEENNLNEENTDKTVSLEKEKVNLNEENAADKTVSLEEEEDNLNEENTDKTVSPEEEENDLDEENTDKTVSLEKEENNLNEESTDKTVSLEKEKYNLNEDSTDKNVSLEEEENNLNEDNTDKNVSLEEEEDNLNEDNTDKNVSLEEEDSLNEDSTDKNVSLEEEEDSLNEDNTDKNVSLKEEEDNLNEDSTDKNVSLEEEEDNLNEDNTDKNVSLEEEDSLNEDNTDKNVSLEEEENNLNEDNTDKNVSLEEEEDNLNEDSTDKNVSLEEEEDNLNEDSTDKNVSLEEEDNLNEDNTDKNVSLKEEEDNLNEENADWTVCLEEDDNLNKENKDKTVSLEEEDDNLNEESIDKMDEDGNFLAYQYQCDKEDNLYEESIDKTVSLDEECHEGKWGSNTFPCDDVISLFSGLREDDETAFLLLLSFLLLFICLVFQLN